MGLRYYFEKRSAIRVGEYAVPYVEIPGAEIYFEAVGAGDPILFLHSSFSRGILDFAAQFSVFQSRYRCFVPDMRGHGRTRSPQMEWTTASLADDIPALLDGLGVEAAHVIGFSLGGDVALYGAVRYPERFRSLVTIGAGAMNTDGMKRMADEYEPEVLERTGKKTFIELLRANHAEAHGGDWRRFAQQTLHSWRSYPQLSDQELREIQTPCLFLAGEADPLVGSVQLNRMCDCVAGATYQLIEGCGHRPHMMGNRPDQVNELILTFLAGA